MENLLLISEISLKRLGERLVFVIIEVFELILREAVDFMKKNEQKLGIIYACFSYCLWGVLPVYWKWLKAANSDEILASRIFWSFVFMLFVLLFSRKMGEFIQVVKDFRHNKKQLLALTAASLLISANWFIYIWAVNSNQMVEASLGYYINPLISVLLGLFVLKEKLTGAQILSFVLAFIGVLILSISFGRLPWIALSLALSFAIYGLVKKLLQVDSAIGLTLETMVISPFAAIYIGWLFVKNEHAFLNISITTDLLLIGAGAVTAIPLLYFAKGVQRIPLSMLGFLQYIAPTITLFLGIFIYHEPFSTIDVISFLFIWLALVIYSLSRTRLFLTWGMKWRRQDEVGM